jgi:hypothetical protein
MYFSVVNYSLFAALLFLIDPASSLARMHHIGLAYVQATICFINPASISAAIIFNQYGFCLIEN